MKRQSTPGIAFVLLAAWTIFTTKNSHARDALESSSETPTSTSSSADSNPNPDRPTPKIWATELGHGFYDGAKDLEMSIGAAFGLSSLIGHHNHDLLLTSVRYSLWGSGVMAESHWYRGNFSLLGELFAGLQYHPHNASVVGITPTVRYTFATRARWMPFLDAGFGPSFTDIGGPDISSKFEFNIQGGGGVHYFWNDRHAVTVSSRMFHLSNLGLERPNQGVNACLVMIGTSWFF